VPLDGSGEAETALPYAREFALRMALEVILVRVTRGAISAPISAALLQAGRIDVDAEIGARHLEYLDGIGSPMAAACLNVQTKVLHGAPASTGSPPSASRRLCSGHPATPCSSSHGDTAHSLKPCRRSNASFTTQAGPRPVFSVRAW